MLEIKIDKQFKKDIKRDKQSGKYKTADFETLKSIMDTLIDGNTPNEKYYPHKLVGDWKGYCECHIKSNWILIYKQTDSLINFARIGTHQQLFNNF